MDCREFEDIINELVRAKMINSASRAAGLAHAEICGRCASRLADEHALGAGLKSLAASDEGKAAPASVEVTLLEAFRAQSSNSLAGRLPVRSRNWPRWALAAAAILIAFGLIVYRAIQNAPQKDNGVITEKTPAPQPSVKPEEQVVKEKGEPPAVSRGSRPPRPRRGNRPRLNKPFIIDSITTYAKDSEYVTDFFPLTYGGDQKSMQSGEVIRVQMPRSALIAFGLPVNIERADVPVEADLLIGEDGLTRAIRFVR